MHHAPCSLISSVTRFVKSSRLPSLLIRISASFRAFTKTPAQFALVPGLQARFGSHVVAAFPFAETCQPFWKRRLDGDETKTREILPGDPDFSVAPDTIDKDKRGGLLIYCVNAEIGYRVHAPFGTEPVCHRPEVCIGGRRPAFFTAFPITSPMTTTGIPSLSAIFENSPLPLAGSPTTPITFIDNFTSFTRPDEDPAREFVRNRLEFFFRERGNTLRHTLLEDEVDIADLFGDDGDLVIVAPEERYNDLELGQRPVFVASVHRASERCTFFT